MAKVFAQKAHKSRSSSARGDEKNEKIVTNDSKQRTNLNMNTLQLIPSKQSGKSKWLARLAEVPVVCLTALSILELIACKQPLAGAESVGLIAVGNESTPIPLIAAPSGDTSGLSSAEDSMKFPLYMRVIATIACLLILSVGVCGNLLVPLVVIKTKYLRNSTNLFLINLSVADLLVLIVCMPTVLIELHSRPETWLLGESMCKISNYVEMLAANGSIFTILAISFERYYAICQPLKAGYKCTRLRATIIICAIWLITSILTSPILIMAKFSQTVYIDGSLVYNCLLETDTYWPKFYVYASMFAFFCLPLIVLMIVYWLISRRLIRENIAMSTTTSLTTGDSTPNSQASSVPCQIHHHYDCSMSSTTGNEPKKLTKTGSLRSISNFLSSFHHSHGKQYTPHKTTATILARSNHESEHKFRKVQVKMSPSYKHRLLRINKTLSLDHHHLMIDSVTSTPSKGEVNDSSVHRNGGTGVDLSDYRCRVEEGLNRADSEEASCLKRAFSGMIVRKFFNFKRNDESDCKSSYIPPIKSAKAENGPIRAYEYMLNSKIRLQTSEGSDLARCNDIDQSSQAPFLDMSPIKSQQLFDDSDEKNRELDRNRPGRQSGGFRFRWAKRFSVSSSSASTQTNCTTLLSESSVSGHERIRTDDYATNKPRSIIRKNRPSRQRRIAHFDVSPAHTSNIIQCSSTSESSGSPFSSSKSPSPESMVISAQKISYNIEKTNEHTNQPKDCSTFGLDTISQFKPPEISVSYGSPTHGINSKTGEQVQFIAEELQTKICDSQTVNRTSIGEENKVSPIFNGKCESPKIKLASIKGRSLDNSHHHFPFNLRRSRNGSHHKSSICSCKPRLSEVMVIQDLSKKQQMDSRRQVVVMLAFVVGCFFLLFLPYRVFTIWLILSTDDQVQSLGMETYYNLTYFSRILIYLHSAINPIAYNLISTKFRRAFMSILLCRGASSRRHFTAEHRIINNNKASMNDSKSSNAKLVRQNRQ